MPTSEIRLQRPGSWLTISLWLFLLSLWWSKVPCCELCVEAQCGKELRAATSHQPPASCSVVSSTIKSPTWQGTDASSQQPAKTRGPLNSHSGEPWDDCSPACHLDHSLMRDSDPGFPVKLCPYSRLQKLCDNENVDVSSSKFWNNLLHSSR